MVSLQSAVPQPCFMGLPSETRAVIYSQLDHASLAQTSRVARLLHDETRPMLAERALEKDTHRWAALPVPRFLDESQPVVRNGPVEQRARRALQSDKRTVLAKALERVEAQMRRQRGDALALRSFAASLAYALDMPALGHWYDADALRVTGHFRAIDQIRFRAPAALRLADRAQDLGAPEPQLDYTTLAMSGLDQQNLSTPQHVAAHRQEWLLSIDNPLQAAVANAVIAGHLVRTSDSASAHYDAALEWCDRAMETAAAPAAALLRERIATQRVR